MAQQVRELTPEEIACVSGGQTGGGSCSIWSSFCRIISCFIGSICGASGF